MVIFISIKEKKPKAFNKGEGKYRGIPLTVSMCSRKVYSLFSELSKICVNKRGLESMWTPLTRDPQGYQMGHFLFPDV